MTTKELFLKLIDNGNKAAELITDPAQKANAYASLALAVATTGAVKFDESSEPKTKEALKKETSKKNSKKKQVEEAPTPVAEPAPVVEEEIVMQPVEQEPAEEAPVAVAEVEPVEEVVEETVEQAQEETVETEEEGELDAETAEAYEYVQWLIEEFDVETLEQFLAFYSENELTTLDDLNQDNIKGYAAYMKSEIARQNEEA